MKFHLLYTEQMILGKVERHISSFVDSDAQTGKLGNWERPLYEIDPERRPDSAYDIAFLVTIIPLFGNAKNVSGSKS